MWDIFFLFSLTSILASFVNMAVEDVVTKLLWDLLLASPCHFKTD
jgi:hypothetical protein